MTFAAIYFLGLAELLILGAIAAAVVGAMVYAFSGKDRKDE